nr:unnamed protein product [Spirometra erinaceieuropaei]
MPDYWKELINGANFSQEEKTNHPKEIINAVKTYEVALKNQENDKFLGVSVGSMPDGEEDDHERKNASASENGKPDHGSTGSESGSLPEAPRPTLLEVAAGSPKSTKSGRALPAVNTAANNQLAKSDTDKDIISELKSSDAFKKQPVPKVNTELKAQPPAVRRRAKKKMTDAEFFEALEKIITVGDPHEKYVMDEKLGSGAQCPASPNFRRLNQFSLSEAIYLIQTHDRPEPKTEGVDPLLKAFLDRCLQVNPENRASAAELLEHPFLKNTRSLAGLQALIEAARQNLGKKP